MRQIPLYTSGGVSLSPLNADDRRLSDYVRIIADDGMGITNGYIITTCIDTKTPEMWTDCALPESEE